MWIFSKYHLSLFPHWRSFHFSGLLTTCLCYLFETGLGAVWSFLLYPGRCCEHSLFMEQWVTFSQAPLCSGFLPRLFSGLAPGQSASSDVGCLNRQIYFFLPVQSLQRKNFLQVVEITMKMEWEYLIGYQWCCIFLHFFSLTWRARYRMTPQFVQSWSRCHLRNKHKYLWWSRSDVWLWSQAN